MMVTSAAESTTAVIFLSFTLTGMAKADIDFNILTTTVSGFSSDCSCFTLFLVFFGCVCFFCILDSFLYDSLCKREVSTSFNFEPRGLLIERRLLDSTICRLNVST